MKVLGKKCTTSGWEEAEAPHTNGAFSLIFQHRYLTATTLMIMVFTWLVTSGDYILVGLTESENCGTILRWVLLAVEAGARLKKLRQVARERKNMFEALMEAERVCLLGNMSRALYDVRETIGRI